MAIRSTLYETKSWRLKEPTRKQLDLLHELGHRVPPRNRGHASDLINQTLGSLARGERPTLDLIANVADRQVSTPKE